MYYKIPFTGDINSEFGHFVLAVLVIAVLSLAWWTTSIRDTWQVRAVYFLDTRLRRTRYRHFPRLTNHTVSSTLVESIPSIVAEPDPVTEVVEAVNSVEETKAANTAGEESSGVENQDGPATIIEKMDADNNLVREKRLEFFNKRTDVADSNEASCSTLTCECSHSPITDTIEDIEASDTEIIECAMESDANLETEQLLDDENSVKIKLKFLNDDMRVVDCQLSELLGEFKRRHFQTELSENKVVKLIFNGQVLHRDDDTLQSYGFFNNCVVHCLVRQQRLASEEYPDAGGANERSRGGRSNQRDWDLGNLFIILISVFLSSAWYFRYQYPQFFTITATMALVIITGLFAVISLGTFFPDPEIARPETHVIH